MKVEKTKGQPFKPVTISITFETQEELDAIKDFSGNNVSLPQMYKEQYSVSDREKSYLSELLSNIYDIL